jgi:hypothetical protein
MRTLDVYAELSIHVDAADAETTRNETTRSSAKLNAVLDAVELREAVELERN